MAAGIAVFLIERCSTRPEIKSYKKKVTILTLSYLGSGDVYWAWGVALCAPKHVSYYCDTLETPHGLVCYIVDNFQYFLWWYNMSLGMSDGREHGRDENG